MNFLKIVVVSVAREFAETDGGKFCRKMSKTPSVSLDSMCLNRKKQETIIKQTAMNSAESFMLVNF